MYVWAMSELFQGGYAPSAKVVPILLQFAAAGDDCREEVVSVLTYWHVDLICASEPSEPQIFMINDWPILVKLGCA